jgi:2-keto-4-pentenoate hydratase
MLSAAEIAAAVEALDTAERTRKQTGLLSLKHPQMTMDDAYAVQQAWMKRKVAAGRRVIGWKIGLTSKAMQYALNIDIPDSGVLLDDMMFADGAVIPADRFIQPRIEAEIAFMMKAPLKGPGVTVADVLAATETGLGAGVLNDPALGIAWLANRLGQYGDSIEAGQVVLSGSFIRPVEAQHGSAIVADFGPHGTVRCHFA